MRFATTLPIDDVLDDVGRVLAGTCRAVLVAPPGAGKTTRVPLALLDAPWLGQKKVLVLEPRRLAARAAAERMAQTLAECVGETVGLRARFVSKTGPKTRIEVITEGVFTRLILDDPELSGVGAVLFDEFHERSLDADLGLALALDCQQEIRSDLRLAVMSATLDGGRIGAHLGNAPVVQSLGQSFAVETRYVGKGTSARIEDTVTEVVLRVLRAEAGSILAFLPGQGEIRRVAERLESRVCDPSVVIAPLFGSMDLAAQAEAIDPAPAGKRKVVLATSIAESSLTIQGVRVVVDCGFSRVPRFEPDAGITRLVTVRVSRASADQRRGRAGRIEPGVCYRMWDEPETASLMPFNEPEIRTADLAGLVLDCREWGVRDPRELRWLDPPATSAVEAAQAELVSLGAIDGDGNISDAGRRMRTLPLPPRLSFMMLKAAQGGDAEQAAEIAAVLVERWGGGNGTDIEQRIEAMRRDRSRRAGDVKQLAKSWARAARSLRPGHVNEKEGQPSGTAALLALAYPDRIAKARGARGHYLLASGRGAFLDAADPMAGSRFLVVAELQGGAAATRILLASRAEEADILAIAKDRVIEADEVWFDRDAGSLKARRVRRLDAIELASEPRPVAGSHETALALADGAASLGIAKLPWTGEQRQLRDRVAFLRAGSDADWPDVSDESLAATARGWLAPFLTGKKALAQIGAGDLGQALDALIAWSLKQRLAAEAPTHFTAPSGERHAIRYDEGAGPQLHIRVQELYGLKVHPSIAGGRLPLILVLLSPARRPIQVTRDLPGFWAGSWKDVQADMRGRYPKHFWPDAPANAMPTARAKPRGT